MDSSSIIRVPVPLGRRAYEIAVVTRRPDLFGAFAREALSRTWAGSACRSALIVTDSHVAGLSLPLEYQSALGSVGIEPTVAIVPAGESSKSLELAGRLYDELIKIKADRHTLIVALGGGVIGDLAG